MYPLLAVSASECSPPVRSSPRCLRRLAAKASSADNRPPVRFYLTHSALTTAKWAHHPLYQQIIIQTNYTTFCL